MCRCIQDDALKRALVDGELAQVQTAVGTITLPVQISDRIMPGVICIPHGWGHTRAETKLSIAAKNPGVSLNDVLNDLQVDPISGNAVLNGQVAKVNRLAI